MGSTCSSAQRKAGKGEEERRASTLSTDSMPYGGSPKGERKVSNSRPMPPPEQPTLQVHTLANNKKPSQETPPSTAPPSTATPNSANQPTGKGVPISPSHSEGGIPDLSQFPEAVLPLVMGRWDQVSQPPSRSEITLYIGGNYSGPLRLQLWKGVYPALRLLCAEKGFNLLVVDVDQAQTVEGPHQGVKGGALSVLSNGSPLLLLLLMNEGSKTIFVPPADIAKEDLDTALNNLGGEEEKADLLRKSYVLRGNCFHIRSDLQVPEAYQPLMDVLREVLPNKDTYLKSEIEKELTSIVDSEGGLAKRTLWIQLPLDEAQEEQPASVQQVKGRLQEQIPDCQRHLIPASGMQAAAEMLTAEIKKLLEGAMEEEFVQACKMPYKGMEDPLFEELHYQASKCKAMRSLPLFHREKETAQIKSYLQQEGKPEHPLVLHSARGMGRTRLLSELAMEASHWLPSNAALSLSLLPQGAVLRSTSEHCCALYGLHPSQAFLVQGEEHPLEGLLSRVCVQRPLVVVLDDFHSMDDSQLLHKLSISMPPNLRIILSVQTDSSTHKQLQSLLEASNHFVELQALNPEQGLDIVQATTSPIESESLKSTVLEHLEKDPSPAQAVLVGHWLCQVDPCELPSSCDSLVGPLIEHTGSLGARVLSLLSCVRHGLSLPELLELLEEPEIPSSLMYWRWISVRQKLGPLLTDQVVKKQTMLKLNPYYVETVCSHLGVEVIGSCKEELKVFFGRPEAARHRQAVEIPFLHDPAEDSFKDSFLLNPDWLCKRAENSDPSLLLEDIQRVRNARPAKEDLELMVLSEVLQSCSYALRYDGSQLLCQLYRHLLHHPSLKTCPSLQKLLNVAARPSRPALLPIRVLCKSPPSTPSHDATINHQHPQHQQQAPQVLHTMRGCVKHMLSLSPHAGVVTVWDVYAQEAVRTLTGVFEPKDAKMVDEKRCLLLCNRELKLYDLDQGCLVLKLKGVMNQHMAYFGLHGSNYVVALSRNRMYVNMMNLNTGDLETTFKVGEDRFLNSLLVSGNGRICVCGDETQKPFPLLVWDLDNRKLLYDLRIPHHEFLTHMSAISHDGHYVVCVCKELEDGSPNFIIVYDLQSGTLFKKWKPESDSCSIAISAPHGVVNSLDNSLVLVWDLVTGARKYNFRGHSAPVDQIKMDTEGARCLTFDSTGKDRSIRLWDLAVGECLAVLTPDVALTCAQLTLDGGAVVTGFKGSSEVVTYVLCHQNTVQEAIAHAKDFGDPQRRAMTFDVSKQG